jgi:hypothetical protein
MSPPEDKNPERKTLPARDGVRHDARGNAVWQWAVESGRHLMESTSLMLKRLEVPGLKLEDEANTQEKKTVAKPEINAGPASSAGYDPYGNKRVAQTSTPRPRPAPTKPAEAPPPRRSWWQRLFRPD